MRRLVHFERIWSARLVVSAAMVTACVAGQASSQTPPQPTGASAGDAPKTMTIHVHVSDNHAQAIDGLQESDFTLLDNKQPQKLLGFRAVDAASLQSNPVQVLIAVDMVNADPVTVAREREEIGAYLKGGGGELPSLTSLAVIADSGVKVLPLSTRRGDLLLASFNQTQSEIRGVGRSAGFYGATENAQKSLLELGQLIQFEGQKPGRKLVLLVSPGWPLLIAAGDQSDLKQRTWVFNNVVQFTNLLNAANVALYCIDPFDLGRRNPFEYQGYVKGVSKPDDATYPDLGLQVLAVHTGGQVFVSGRDMAGSLKTAIRDASEGYDLTFAPAPGDRANEYHALEVRVDEPKVKVRTTAGYYARVQGQRRP